jgi:hypothetical protein
MSSCNSVLCIRRIDTMICTRLEVIVPPPVVSFCCLEHYRIVGMFSFVASRR